MNFEFALILLSFSVWLVAAQVSQQCFRQLSNGLLCIRSEFTRTLDTADLVRCSIECNLEQRCQAFTTADGPCQLFVFDKCSKSVRDCRCSRRGRLFVKRQLGLEPGALCPSGYGDELCGVTYRLINETAKWSDQRQRCESEPGLVIMADVTDAAELSHVNSMYTAHSPGIPVYLGGYRMFTGATQTNVWLWVGCNITVFNVWALGEPNDVNEKSTALYPGVTNLVDITDMELAGALCECVSPFT